jgi:hypothetical protein
MDYWFSQNSIIFKEDIAAKVIVGIVLLGLPPKDKD